MNLAQRIMNVIESNEKVQEKINSNDVTKHYWDVLKSGDQNAGEALATQIMNTYGLKKDDAIKQASEGLNNMFGSR